MAATLRILKAGGANLVYDELSVKQLLSLVRDADNSQAPWEILRQNRVFLKAPVTTPQGGGYKSLNVTIRKALSLFGNIRPCRSYAPFVHSLKRGVDVVIIRENEEDTYAGIEYRLTYEATQCLKLTTRPGCERIIRLAFAYARAHGRKRVTCMTKDNIMKMTDGLFHEVFDEVAALHPELAANHMIVDIGIARMAAHPENFDIVVVPNLYGDILSDVAAEITGSVGLAASANLGPECAMFEAVHGSAPDISGKNLANPSGLLLAAVMMLEYLGQQEASQRVKDAWLTTIEQGLHTRDIYRQGVSSREMHTSEFTAAVIDNLGQEPKMLRLGPSATISMEAVWKGTKPQRAKPSRTLVGVDVYLYWDDPERDPERLGAILTSLDFSGSALRLISNRGVKVYPDGVPETTCSDFWRCRYLGENEVKLEDILRLVRGLMDAGVEPVKTEHLYTYDDQPGYSAAQGE